MIYEHKLYLMLRNAILLLILDDLLMYVSFLVYKTNICYIFVFYYIRSFDYIYIIYNENQ